MKNAEHSIPSLNSPLNTKCNYPSYYFFIDYTGEVLMCSHDWGKKIILGNMNKDNFLDIWTSKKAIAIQMKNQSLKLCRFAALSGSTFSGC